MPDNPAEEWDIVTYEVDGWTVRLSWLGLTPQFQLIDTDLPVFSSIADLRRAREQLIKGEEAMQMTYQSTAPDALAARQQYLATHVAAVKLMEIIAKRRETECI